ncbi:5-formyltetrahydrofolate cyclo-ligase isoform X1 [Loxodonta africana]|uniref:5-formyltetrahydrofolate cyclo-ligase isoform X1 n=1 Tax=Loxodonta africana TaxID=9785 RepID=UPI000C810A6B|nr:5-formyltetrahydrofolate cyclo-ligase isoform X1 [Loxodonta africana]
MAAAAAAVRGAKQSLRAELKQRLQAMSAEERLRQSRLLTQKVIAHSQYQKSRRISIFLSMQDEIETEEIIKDIFQQGKTCFIPQYQFQSNHMEMVKLASPEEISLLPKTSWNIHQPAEGEVREEALSTGRTFTESHASESTLVMKLSFFGVVLYSTKYTGRTAKALIYNGAFDLNGGLDLIFMPGLGFDKHGNRLGRGKGYYDSYLKRCLQQQEVKPYTMALAFKEQICHQVPVDEHDMKVDEVLYEDPSTS